MSANNFLVIHYILSIIAWEAMLHAITSHDLRGTNLYINKVIHVVLLHVIHDFFTLRMYTYSRTVINIVVINNYVLSIDHN